MFLDKIKILTTILIAFLMISVSANVIAFSRDTELNESKKVDEELNNNEALASSQVTDEEVITPLQVEKVSPNEIFETYPELVENSNYYPSKYLEGQSVEPISLPVDGDYDDQILSPDQLLRLMATAGANSEPHSLSSSNARGPGPDAGNHDYEATELTDGSTWYNDSVDCEIVGNPPQWSILDVDWFRVAMEVKGSVETDYLEIRIENTAPVDSSGTFSRRVRCFMFEPMSVILNASDTYPFAGPNSGKAISKADGETIQYYLDLELIDPGANATLNAISPISGNLYILLWCLSDINLRYNITSVSITQVSPEDNNNFPENGTKPQTNSVNNQKVTQHLDHWDWYDISNYIDTEVTGWDTKISYTVDITNAGGSGNDFHSWVTTWVLYDEKVGNNIYLNGHERNVGGAMTRSGTEPITHSFTMQGEHAYLGIRVRSMIVDQGEYYFTTSNGWAQYDLSFGVDLQNIGPQLLLMKIEPEKDYYFLEDDITFKVTYRDSDNNPPSYVRVTVDGLNHDLDSIQNTFVTGAEYKETYPATTFGISPYPHVFNFSANDGLADVNQSLQKPKNEFKVIENQTPKIYNTAPKVVLLEEDDDDSVLSLDQIFEDVDKTDGIDFYIKQADSYGKKFESSRMEVFVTDAGSNLKIQLKANQHGSDVVSLQAKETLKRSADTYTFFAYYNLNITITSLNDEPSLDPITDIQAHEDYPITIPITATDPDIFTDDDELTFSTNRSDGEGPDEIMWFNLTPDETDTSKANITFTPLNEHVGKFLVKVTVKDNEGAEDSLDVEFDILNTNDPPVITEISTDKTKEIIEPAATTVEFTSKKYCANEDEWFNMTVKLVDLDISIGEQNDIEFKVYNSTFSGTINIDHAGGSALSAIVSVLPRNSDVGKNYINLSVHDGKGGSDEISIKVLTNNVNDPPETPIILKPEGENSTFSIVDNIQFQGQSDDEDFYIRNSNEELTYKWLLAEVDGGDFDDLYTSKETTNDISGFSLKPAIRSMSEGQYIIKLVVRDIEEAEKSTQITIAISEDFDGDNIYDVWEDLYGLNPHNRRDAMEDLDGDGYSNLREFLGKDGEPGGDDSTNPYDPTERPAGKEAEADNSLLIYSAIVIIIIIILIILFMFVRGRRKAKKDLEDLDRLAYPEEETDMEMATPMGTMPMPGPPGPGIPPKVPPGVPPTIPPHMMQQFMAMNEMQRMQFFQMMQKQQMATQGKPGGVAGAGKPMQKSQSMPEGKDLAGTIGGTDKGPQLDSVSMKPQLPPGKSEGIEEKKEPEIDNGTSGRHAPIDSLTKDELGDLNIEDMGAGSDKELELISGEPVYISEQEVKDLGITESEEGITTSNGDAGETEDDEMKCPNCGVNVKSGWFLCPGCKSPLN